MLKLLQIAIFQLVCQGISGEDVTFTFGQDIDYPPYAYKNATTGELEGVGKDIADGMTALCSDITINVVEVNWQDCWNGTAITIGNGLNNGTYDACMTFTNTKGVRNEYIEFSGSILSGKSKPAGLLVKLDEDGLPEVVDGMDDLSNKTIVDVKGWAPTADTIAFVENKCTGEPYSRTLNIIPNIDGANDNEEALKMVLDGTVDAMYVYADQAYYYKKECEKDPAQEWNCSVWTEFGTDFAYVQTGQFGYLRNGTTLAMAKLGSGVADRVNPCLWQFMQTKEYYDICVKHGVESICFPNDYFPISDDHTHVKPYFQETDEHTTGCEDGYCACTISTSDGRSVANDTFDGQNDNGMSSDATVLSSPLLHMLLSAVLLLSRF